MSTRAASSIAVVAALMLAARTGWAQPAPPRVVALVPLSVLGTEDTSVATKKLTSQLEAALAGLPNTKVVTSAQSSSRISS